jgi:hydrogenase-4 component F
MNPLALVVLAPFAASLVPLAFPAGPKRRRAKVGFAALAALAPIAMAGRVDGLSLGFAALVSTLGFLATAFSVGGAIFDQRVGDIVGDPDEAVTWSRVSVYYALLGAFWSAMLLVVLADNFAILWLGISATTLATAFLVGFAGEAESLEAAWKYLVLCSVGIAFALFGSMVLAHVTLAFGLDPAHALSWAAIVQAPPLHSPPLARLAIALMTIGFATKAGLVPMHAWLPDAHSKAPAPVSGLLSGVLVSCALYALMRTLAVATALGAGPLAHALLLWLGALSTVVAGALMLTQTDLKRLLAYSTVEHAGIVALALGFGGKLGTLAALVHLLAHAFAKSAAFLATGLVQRERRTTSLAKLRGLWHSGTGGRMLLAALTALGGLPPFGIFVSELLVVAAGVLTGQWAALVLGLIGMAFAFAALSRAAIEIESGRPAGLPARGTGSAPSSAGSAPSSIGAAALALGGAVAVALVPWTPLGGLIQAVAAGIGAGKP